MNFGHGTRVEIEYCKILVISPRLIQFHWLRGQNHCQTGFKNRARGITLGMLG